MPAGGIAMPTSLLTSRTRPGQPLQPASCGHSQSGLLENCQRPRGTFYPLNSDTRVVTVSMSITVSLPSQV